MALSNLVYDRTQADVSRWLALAKRMDSEGWSSLTPEEQAEWINLPKGCYNYTDMNRVGSAVSYLAMLYRQMPGVIERLLRQNGVADDALFRVPFTAEDVDVHPWTNWRMYQHITESDAAQYLRNLTILRGLLPVPEGTPEVPSDMDGFTYQEANDIERLLFMLEAEFLRKNAELRQWIQNTAAAWTYSAEPFCGEV